MRPSHSWVVVAGMLVGCTSRVGFSTAVPTTGAVRTGDPVGSACTTDTDCPGACVDGTCAPPCTVHTWDLRITATEDDGEISREFAPAGTWFPDGEATYGSMDYFGSWSNAPSEAYFRFALPEAVPATAQVTAATLDVWVGNLTWWDKTAAIRVGLEDSADAPAVADATDTPAGGGRALLPTPRRWPAAGGLVPALDAFNPTPDMSAAFMGLLSAQGDLAAGTHVQLWLWGDDLSVDQQIGAHDFATPAAHVAQLHLTGCW